MKAYFRITICCFLLAAALGCETYKDYEIEYSPVYPLCGEWLVRFTDTSVTPNVTSGLIVMSTFNTADNSISRMWIRTTSASSAYPGRFTGKIDCNVESKSFSGSDALNTYYTSSPVPTFTITEGVVVIDGYDTATGGKSDKITFTMTDSRKSGITYKITGFRRTRWSDDEV